MENNSSKFTALTDHELYRLCKQYGTNARLWMRKFAGLLPEVYRRRLYKRRGYASIHEFAAKLAGMSAATVDKILRISAKLNDKPILREKLESGEIGWSKLEKVAYVATKETDATWAERAEHLGTQALEKYIKEYRKIDWSNNRLEVTHMSNFSGENLFGENELHCPAESDSKAFSFSIPPDLEEKFRLLKQKIEKEKDQTLTFHEVLRELMTVYEGRKEEKGIEKKIITVELCAKCLKREADEKEQNGEVTRWIPAKIQKFILKRSGGKCEFSLCLRPGEIFHHTRRYALRKNHDPQYIVFLCKSHEGLLQAGYIENEEKSPALWKIREEPDQDDVKILIDEKVMAYRGDPVSRAALQKPPVSLPQSSDP